MKKYLAHALQQFTADRQLLRRARTQVRLFRDGQAVFSGPAQAYDPGRQTNASRLQAGGRLQLGGSLQPGEYSLRVVVTDELVKGKSGTATRWIDFEIVK